MKFLSGGIIGDLGDLKQLLEKGFDVRWKVDTSHCKECEKFERRCGFDAGAKEFRCLCPEDQPSSSSNNACTTEVPAGAVSPGTGNSKLISSLATPPGIARKLASFGYGVVAMDYPAFGLSESLHGYILSLDNLVDDVIEHFLKVKDLQFTR